MFIGKKYSDKDRTDGGFDKKWGEAFDNGLIESTEKAELRPAYNSEYFEDSDAYIGLMRSKENEPFEYWIGKFVSPETPVPAGLDSVSFPASTLGVGLLYGKENELYCHEPDVASALEKRV